MTDNDYISAYIETIDAKPHNTKKLFAVGMIGLVGIGKSTFAEALGKELGLYVASNDRIRRWLNTQGFPGDAPKQKLVQQIAVASSKYLYAHNISQIIDNDLIQFHESARKNAITNGAEFFLVHVVAPEDVAIARLTTRTAAVKNNQAKTLSRAGLDEYFIRKSLHERVRLPDDILLTVNTNDDIITSINSLQTILKNYGVI